jgi:predicted NACHT family NTPase
VRIESQGARMFRIYDAPKLDPILVVMQDLGAGNGRLLIECFGDAWSGYWGAMGERSIEQFVLSCSADYIAGKMLGAQHKRNRTSEAYILRIVQAVQTALRDGDG